MIFWFCFLFTARMTEGVVSSSFKKTSVYIDYLDIQPYPGVQVNDKQLCAFFCLANVERGIDCSLFLVRKETCYVGKQCIRGPGYFCVSNVGNLSVEDRERIEEGMGLDKMVEVFQNSSIQGQCEIPKNQPNGKFHCYNDSEIERCFLMCKPGYVPKLYTGTYCISNTWNRSIDELQCIPATTIVTVGGYGQGHKFQIFKPNNPPQIISVPFNFYFTSAQYFSGKIVVSGGKYSSNQMYKYDKDTPDFKLTQTLQHSFVYATSVLVHDKLYTTGLSADNTEYLQENRTVTVPIGSPVANSNIFHCTVRYLDRFFMVIDQQTTRVYDTVKGTHEFLPPLLKPVNSFGCGTFLDEVTGEELILVTGGYDGFNSVKDCQVFTPSLGVWTTISPLNNPRARHSVVTTVDGVFVVGESHLVEQLNPTTLTWQTVSPDFLAGMQVAAVAVPDDAV